MGDVTRSSRALRQIRAAAEAGWAVSALQTAAPRAPEALPRSATLDVSPITGAGPRLFWRAHRALARLAAQRRADVWLASDLYSLPALARAASAGGALIYDSRELYAALDSSEGRPHVAAVWAAVERRHVRRADAVLTVGDGIADRLADRYGIARPTVLYNAPDPVANPEHAALRRALALPDDGRMLVLYQGLFRPGRGLPALVEASRRVEDVRLVLIGEGAQEPEIRERGNEFGDRLVVHPFVPPDRLAALTPGADLGACLIEPRTESLRLSLPNKLFEYLAAGVPVLASPLPEIARVARDVGVLADPGDPAAVAAALRAALDPTRRAGWRVNTSRALAPHTWSHGRRAFLDLLDRLA